MIEKIELKHFAAYLPYKLKIDTAGYFYELELTPKELDAILGNKWKPILRPLSDLTKEIEIDGEKFVPIDRLNPVPNFFNVHFLINTPQACSFELVQKLLELHFDIFGLIESGLAVDINNLKD